MDTENEPREITPDIGEEAWNMLTTMTDVCVHYDDADVEGTLVVTPNN